MRKSAYRKAWRALQRGDRAPMDAYRREIEAKAAAAEPEVVRKPRSRRTAASLPTVAVRQLAAEWESAKRYAAPIAKADEPECKATTRRDGFRVLCVRKGLHWTHAGVRGEIW
jgi:hypothetical protein